MSLRFTIYDSPEYTFLGVGVLMINDLPERTFVGRGGLMIDDFRLTTCPNVPF
ncbi:hypothetical protein [Gelidibacter japonicus]|uniref:hypothetical protein n=1 Tax=Gelidibacter japonicus TaxID=1962232 RepID=UPI0013D2716C|nr:hypothetical protein [Gelidibacter japonicus]